MCFYLKFAEFSTLEYLCAVVEVDGQEGQHLLLAVLQ